MTVIRDNKVLEAGRAKAVTLSDVAKRAGVAKGTASVVLTGANSPLRVSDETRARIQKAAAELAYQPNALARKLNGVKLKSLGVSYHSVEPEEVTTDPYCLAVMRGIIRATQPLSYNVTLFQRPWLGRRQSAADFRAQGLDGFLIIAPKAGSDMVAGLSELGIPLVVISTSSEVHNVPAVDVDNGKGVRLVVEHLLGLGHRRIAHLHLTGNHASFDSTVRREHFVHVLKEAGVPLPDEYLCPIQGEYRPSTFAAVRHLLSLPNPPTALFTTNDMVAWNAEEAAQSIDVRVPDQLSVAGFDDSPIWPRWQIPLLTTVRQPFEEMAEHAARLLIAQVEGELVPAKTHWFDPELVVRESTAQPTR
jgi:LacI family transcriptional regulator